MLIEPLRLILVSGRTRFTQVFQLPFRSVTTANNRLVGGRQRDNDYLPVEMTTEFDRMEIARHASWYEKPESRLLESQRKSVQQQPKLDDGDINALAIWLHGIPEMLEAGAGRLDSRLACKTNVCRATARGSTLSVVAGVRNKHDSEQHPTAAEFVTDVRKSSQVPDLREAGIKFNLLIHINAGTYASHATFAEYAQEFDDAFSISAGSLERAEMCEVHGGT